MEWPRLSFETRNFQVFEEKALDGLISPSLTCPA
jgi:hypothetical protein